VQLCAKFSIAYKMHHVSRGGAAAFSPPESATVKPLTSVTRLSSVFYW